MQSSTEIFKQFVELYPGVKPYLERVCDRCDIKGYIGGIIRLGRFEVSDDIDILKKLFGDSAISVAVDGDIKLTVSQVFGDRDKEFRKNWINSLYEALSRKRRNLLDSKHVIQKETENMLERWREHFPELFPVYRHLTLRQAFWRKQVDISGAEAVEKKLFHAAEVSSLLLKNIMPLSMDDLGQHCSGIGMHQNDELYNLVGDWLLIMKGDPQVIEMENRKRIFGDHYVFSNLFEVTTCVFGPVRILKNGEWYYWIHNLWEAGESAILSLENIKGIEKISTVCAADEKIDVILCNSETQFTGLRQDRRHILIYPGPHPNAASAWIMNLIDISA